jgi:group I intron endonuclease
MEGCIYLLTCLHNGKRYVGQHNKPDPKRRWKAHLSDAKLEKHTGNILHNSLRKYGEEGFSWEVLYIGAIESLDLMECYYAEMYESYIWDSPGGYNMVECGGANRGYKHSPETKEKLRQNGLNRKHSPESIEKIRQSHTGRKQSQEAKDKVSKANIGKELSLETKEKIRQSKLGTKLSQATIEKVREANIGKKLSLEHIEKIRQAGIQRWQRRKEKKLLIE